MSHSVHASLQVLPRSPYDALQYWQVNVPTSERSETCPDFLLNLSEKNRQTLSTPDEDFRRLTWPEVKELISTNRIDRFQRAPSDLRRYKKYAHDLGKTYGSVQRFIQHERVRWAHVTPSGRAPFIEPSDYKILYNDWPYGIDEDVAHLVVWTKFPLQEEDGPATEGGTLTRRARAEVDDFVTRTFCDEGAGGVARDQVVWFKSWPSLRSVPGLEHFHVMTYKASSAFLDRITGGDRPTVKTFKRLERYGSNKEKNS